MANDYFLGFFRYQTTQKITVPMYKSTVTEGQLGGLTTAQFNCYYSIGTAVTTGTYTTALNGPWAEVATGVYTFWLSTLMTQAVGHGLLTFQVTASGRSVTYSYMVLPQLIYDSFIKGTGTDLIQVDVQQFVGATAGLSAGGIVNSVARYIGSTGTSMTSGTMATSVNAFYVIDKYIGSSNTTFSSGVMSTSNSVIKAMVKNWGSSGTTVASGQMTTSLHAFNALVLSVGTSGATVNSTFPWHQTSAQGFLISTAQLAGLSTLATADFNTMSVLTSANLSTFTTANLVGISTLSTADFNTMSVLTTANLNNLSTFDVAEVVTIATSQLAGLSVLTTANLNNLSTFGVSNVYDVLTHEELMKVVQAQLLGNSSFTGSDLKIYDHAGTSFLSFNITTAERTRTT